AGTGTASPARAGPGAGLDLRRAVHPAELDHRRPVRPLAAVCQRGRPGGAGRRLVADSVAVSAVAPLAPVLPCTAVPAGQLAGAQCTAPAAAAASGGAGAGPPRTRTRRPAGQSAARAGGCTGWLYQPLPGAAPAGALGAAAAVAGHRLAQPAGSG